MIFQLFVFDPKTAYCDDVSLIAQYEFNGNYVDLLGGSILTAFGPANDGYGHNNQTSGFGSDENGTHWYWTSNLSRGGGFWIDVNSEISSNYSIGVRFSFNQTGPGWRKIIDYKNMASDTGFYFYDGGKLRFYNHPVQGSTTVSDNQIVDIIATRSSDGEFIAYIVIDGLLVRELSVDDSAGQAMPSVVDGKPRFGFFYDDNVTGSEATNGGKVYSVKIWNGPISQTDAGTAMNSSIIYSGNGNSGGSVPTDSNEYAEGDEVVISGNTGSLERTGYSFTGWNTLADGTGTAYAAGSVMLMPAGNVNLYAMWEVSSYDVSYDANGGTEGSVPDAASHEYSSPVTVFGNTGSLEITGYSFTGWNTLADGTGTAYAAGSVMMMPAGNVTLYAMWVVNSYDVTYDANGGTEGSLPDAASHEYNSPVTVFGNTGSLERTGYSFTGWNTQADGTGTALTAGSVMLMPAGNITLYAMWDMNQVITGLTLNGLIISDKVYDGSGAAVVLSYGELTGVKEGHSVVLETALAKAVFMNPDPGRDKTVIVRGLYLSGHDSQVYSIADQIVYANIFEKKEYYLNIVEENELEEGMDDVIVVKVDTEKAFMFLEDANEDLEGNIFEIPVSTDEKSVKILLTGQTIKDMEQKKAKAVIKTGYAEYAFMAESIDISALAERFGGSVILSDIVIEVNIVKPDDDEAQLAEDTLAKKGHSILIPSLKFSIECFYKGKKLEVDTFASYAKRLIRIPEGVDPDKITTGVVVGPDGYVRHVPTKISVVKGTYYAEINSLTNSLYSLIWNPYEFIDVKGHVFEECINDMGSRLVINGTAGDVFMPDNSMTRAEFVETVIRALGLKPGMGINTFRDVESGELHEGYITTARHYKLVQGYGDETFGSRDVLTREQAYAIIARAMAITGSGTDSVLNVMGSLAELISDFKDVSKWAGKEVSECINAGLHIGSPDNMIKPKMLITRAEVAMLVRKLLKLSGLI